MVSATAIRSSQRKRKESLPAKTETKKESLSAKTETKKESQTIIEKKPSTRNNGAADKLSAVETPSSKSGAPKQKVGKATRSPRSATKSASPLVHDNNTKTTSADLKKESKSNSSSPTAASSKKATPKKTRSGSKLVDQVESLPDDTVIEMNPAAAAKDAKEEIVSGAIKNPPRKGRGRKRKAVQEPESSEVDELTLDESRIVPETAVHDAPVPPEVVPEVLLPVHTNILTETKPIAKPKPKGRKPKKKRKKVVDSDSDSDFAFDNKDEILAHDSVVPTVRKKCDQCSTVCTLSRENSGKGHLCKQCCSVLQNPIHSRLQATVSPPRRSPLLVSNASPPNANNMNRQLPVTLASISNIGLEKNYLEFLDTEDVNFPGLLNMAKSPSLCSSTTVVDESNVPAMEKSQSYISDFEAPLPKRFPCPSTVAHKSIATDPCPYFYPSPVLLTDPEERMEFLMTRIQRMNPFQLAQILCALDNDTRHEFDRALKIRRDASLDVSALDDAQWSSLCSIFANHLD